MRPEIEDGDGLTDAQIDRLRRWLEDLRGDAFVHSSEHLIVTARTETGELVL